MNVTLLFHSISFFDRYALACKEIALEVLEHCESQYLYEFVRVALRKRIGLSAQLIFNALLV